MMKPVVMNRMLATALVVAGLALWALTTIIGYRAWPALSDAFTRDPVEISLQRECAGASDSLGFQTMVAENEIRVSLPSSAIDELESGFAKVSVLAGLCDGYKLAAFCAGRACGANALFASFMKNP